jgi:hypothetical protein
MIWHILPVLSASQAVNISSPVRKGSDSRGSAAILSALARASASALPFSSKEVPPVWDLTWWKLVRDPMAPRHRRARRMQVRTGRAAALIRALSAVSFLYTACLPLRQSVQMSRCACAGQDRSVANSAIISERKFMPLALQWPPISTLFPARSKTIAA